jgi:uncharacterized membrane protein YbhN (UPF0104 family)
MRSLRLLGLLAGTWMVVYLVREVGWASIRETLSLLGWRYAVVLAYPLTWISLNTVAWRYACHAGARVPPLLTLGQLRVAGETFNSLLPSGYVGGEPIKARLLARSMPLHEAASSVLVAKAAQSVALVIYLGLGLTLAHPGERALRNNPAPLIALALLAAGIGLFLLLLTRRSFSRAGRWLHRVSGHAWLRAQEPRLMALDQSLGRSYREGKGRFLASVAWHGAGWLAGALELALIFWLLGFPLSWTQAWFMGAMAQLAATVGLISPAGIGFYEGGHYMAAVALGLPPSLGLSASLIRRIRELFWDAVGLGLYWHLSRS